MCVEKSNYTVKFSQKKVLKSKGFRKTNSCSATILAFSATMAQSNIRKWNTKNSNYIFFFARYIKFLIIFVCTNRPNKDTKAQERRDGDRIKGKRQGHLGANKMSILMRKQDAI